MPQFEAFSRNLVPLPRDPQLTVQRRGTLSLNKAAHVALGSPDAVELLYDIEERIVGLRPIDSRADNAYFVRASTNTDRGPFVISAMAYTRFYDIDTTRSLRWAAYLADGVLCVNLDDPATPVTSNRARRTNRSEQPAQHDGSVGNIVDSDDGHAMDQALRG